MIGRVPSDPAKWDIRFFGLATQVALWSKDPERKVGCVIISNDRSNISYGYNGFPRPIADTRERLSDPGLKNKLVVHAELNALLTAPFNVTACTMYCTSFPCHECAKAIIQAGIRRLVCPEWNAESSWAASSKLAYDMFIEARIEVGFVKELAS